MALKLFKPYVSWRSILEVNKVLLKGTQLAEGPRVKEFEKRFAEMFAPYHEPVALNSGTSALELAYDLAGLKAGDEVIVPVLTCTATNIPLVRRGVKIVFADIKRDLNISVEDVARKITENTKAIVFVHFGGNSRGLAQLIEIASRHNIPLIEDAAQAIGSDFFARADFTAVSFQAIKMITTGDGGILLCKKLSDANKAKRLRWYGYDRELKHKIGDTDLSEAGYKMHMNDIAAAIGIGNLKAYPKLIAHQMRLQKIYQDAGLFAHTWLAGGFTHNYSYARSVFKNQGIEIGQHHYRNDKYTIFADFKNDCPMMDEVEKKYFFVPYHYGVSEKDAQLIAEIAKGILC